jgi:hypothetical protein
VQLPNGNNLEQGSQAKGRVLYSQPYLNHETIKLIPQTKAQADLMFEVATPAYSRKIDDPINAPHWAAPPGRRPIIRSCWLTDTQSLEFHGTKPFADKFMEFQKSTMPKPKEKKQPKELAWAYLGSRSLYDLPPGPSTKAITIFF